MLQPATTGTEKGVCIGVRRNGKEKTNVTNSNTKLVNEN